MYRKSYMALKYARKSYLTVKIFTVNDEYDPPAYFKGKYGSNNTLELDIILHAYSRGAPTHTHGP